MKYIVEGIPDSTVYQIIGDTRRCKCLSVACVAPQQQAAVFTLHFLPVFRISPALGKFGGFLRRIETTICKAAIPYSLCA